MIIYSLDNKRYATASGMNTGMHRNKYPFYIIKNYTPLHIYKNINK